MRVAVLMSTFNGEKYVCEQIESILSQNESFELDLWVRDDGSKDRTQVILDEYSKQNVLRWYTGDNLKPAHSFLDLLKSVEGYDYYALADQDDFWMPEKIKSGIDSLKDKKGPALYCSNAQLVDSELKSLGRNVYEVVPSTDFYTLMCAGGLLGCTMIFNSELAEIIQKKNIPEKIVMHDFYIAAVCSALNGTITFDTRSFMKYRQHGNNAVGVSYGFVGTILGRMKDITTKEETGIADQAKEILQLYETDLDTDKREWLERIGTYRDSLLNRLLLASSLKTKYMNRNMAIKLRLSILLGNR